MALEESQRKQSTPQLHCWCRSLLKRGFNVDDFSGWLFFRFLSAPDYVKKLRIRPGVKIVKTTLRMRRPSAKPRSPHSSARPRLRSIADLAYITRSTNWITYGARTELEFDEERRKAIADAATVYLAGTASPSSENGESK
jgi:hypothetical protein